MKSRDETLEKFQQFCADVGQPSTLLSDGAKEYIANDFKMFARLKGIGLETSAAYTPQENGKIEKIWDIIVGTARCLGDQAPSKKKYWTFSLNMAFYLKNFCYHSAIKKTPHEAMYGEKPNLSFIKVLVFVAYLFIEKQFRNKIDRKAKKGIFLGLALDSRSFLIGIENDRGSKNKECKVRREQVLFRSESTGKSRTWGKQRDEWNSFFKWNCCQEGIGILHLGIFWYIKVLNFRFMIIVCS